VTVDVTPLFAKLGKLIPETDVSEATTLKNKDVLHYLAKKAAEAKAAKPSCDFPFPLKGLYMFQGMASAALIDLGRLENCNMEDSSADSDLSKLSVQKGVPSAKFGGIGPYLPGGWLVKVFTSAQYHVRWYCPGTLKDGDYCILTESLMGRPYPPKEDVVGLKGHGPMTWIIVQSEGGRKYTRKSWLNFPWATMSESYIKAASTFHEYELLQIIDEDGNLDEEHVQLFMEKLDGQDVQFSGVDAM